MSSNRVPCRRFEGKVAVVTASTDGIGLGIAERLVDEGAAVVVSSRKSKNVEKTVELLSARLSGEARGKVVGIVCHVGNPEDRLNLLKLVSDG
ncbi:Hypothetical protein NTJ_04668 [Nesidiocoris tenuis]|nr:Hypothetical protein NTJ_04668 [Nesidiocoris tenuis]